MSRPKIRPTNVEVSSDRIKTTKVDGTAKVSFNFKRLTHKSNKFIYQDKESPYFLKLLERFRDVSNMNRIELRQHKTLRCHPINFSDVGVSEQSFGVLGPDVCDDAWQFSLSQSEHGRVHGYFIDNIFYVVWLDPEHELYPGKN